MNSLPNTIAQIFLRDRNFYHGKIDGLWGPLSQAAAESWKASTQTAPSAPPDQIPTPDPVPEVPTPETSTPGIIDSDGWYTGAKRHPIGSGRRLARKLGIIEHATAGASPGSPIEQWENADNGILAHFLIERDGSITQCRSCEEECGHAYPSEWTDPVTGEMLNNLNHCTIGIEHNNAESDPAAMAWARKQPGFSSIHAVHPNGGGSQEWECYPDAQIQASITLQKAIIARYGIHFLVGHEEVAPQHRDDPGPAFPWAKIRAALNFHR